MACIFLLFFFWSMACILLILVLCLVQYIPIYADNSHAHHIGTCLAWWDLSFHMIHIFMFSLFTIILFLFL